MCRAQVDAGRQASLSCPAQAPSVCAPQRITGCEHLVRLQQQICRKHVGIRTKPDKGNACANTLNRMSHRACVCVQQNAALAKALGVCRLTMQNVGHTSISGRTFPFSSFSLSKILERVLVKQAIVQDLDISSITSNNCHLYYYCQSEVLCYIL